MKPEDPVRSSSSTSHRDSSSENLRAKSIGCMSGLFQLIYKYHNRRRFLTFGKKQEINKNKKITTSAKPLTQQNAIAEVIPRSPTLPAELRRRSTPENAPATLVARLMGLEHTPSSEEMAVAEKRRRLLGALEKCNEDLKALKKIIEMVKSDRVEDPSSDQGNAISEAIDFDRVIDKAELQPSPVSVLDEFTHSSKRFSAHNGRVLPQQQKKKPGEEEITNNLSNFFDKINTEILQDRILEAPPTWTSKAMVESVNEVCRDIEWGQNREIGRIGLALQNFIYRDLVEETVKEILMVGACSGDDYYDDVSSLLPFESCKRRLSF